ncbi:type II secretion system GspH family protein [Nocardioides panacisoli]|uniref:type IV pilus modification PilV family protein n=1 Tax=Nocardioides panacisoli TaxID=627624 RepID=UPI001C6279C2|nr:type II secretion system GspH family protein [Nocardioides panacisoli]QYJ04591.1 type II secretion system GspH family protein [Nocardioides panacisoli]
MRSRAVRDDAGATLVETVVALTILGLAAVAILGGIEFSIRSSDVHRKQATGGAYVRSLAEAVQDHVGSGHYQDCAGADHYTGQVSLGTLPAGYTTSQSAAQSWNGTAWVGCSGGDDGIQRVRLSVTSPGDAQHSAAETMYVVLRRPCDGPVGNPC